MNDVTSWMVGLIALATTRKDAAVVYQYGLRNNAVDWKAVNDAILDRWSKSGLAYIKKEAWG